MFVTGRQKFLDHKNCQNDGQYNRKTIVNNGHALHQFTGFSHRIGAFRGYKSRKSHHPEFKKLTRNHIRHRNHQSDQKNEQYYALSFN
jgi:hypothetical protein